jgi:multidrug transporter EmrE-like cation transporter
MKSLLLIFLSVFAGAVGQIFLKLGAMRSSASDEIDLFKTYVNFYVIFGLFLYGTSALIWILALRKVELSYAYPMVSFGYVIVFLVSIIFLGESVSFMKIIGLIVILIGIIIISRS